MNDKNNMTQQCECLPAKAVSDFQAYFDKQQATLAQQGAAHKMPHPQCDEACYYHCTEGGTINPPKCEREEATQHGDGARIKTWQERTGNHSVRPGSVKHMLAEIAELRAALAATQSEAFAFREWVEKTNWVQENLFTFPVSALGKHRADVMREEIERLRFLTAHAAVQPASGRDAVLEDIPANHAVFSATSFWLDAVGKGANLPRNEGEACSDYRHRIIKKMRQDIATHPTEAASAKGGA